MTTLPPLLSRIFNNIEERVTDEGELSISQCARKLFCTKQRPSRFIQQLLDDHGQHDLGAALHETLQHLSSMPRPTIVTVSAYILLLQLAIELSFSNGQTYQQFIMSLLSTLQKSLDLPDQSNQSILEVLNPKESSHIPTLRAYLLHILLRAINPYISSALWLLPIIFKLVDSLITPHLPGQFLQQCVVALLVYIQRGIDEACEAEQEDQQVFVAKMLLFLLARLTRALPAYLQSASEEEEEVDFTLLHECFSALCSVDSLAEKPVFNKVASKAEACVCKALLSNQQHTLDRTILQSALLTCDPSRGKSGLLLGLLQQTPCTEPNAQVLLVLAEQLIFDLLPRYPRLLEQIVLDKVTQALHLLRKEKPVNAMLLSWLSRCHHVLTRELAVTLVTSCASEDLTRLSCQLVVDSRIATHHRQALTSVLVRLLPTQQHVSTFLVSNLANLIEMLQIAGKKRKRSQRHSLTISDWACLLQLASRIDYSQDDTTNRQIQRLLHTLGTGQKDENAVIFGCNKWSPLQMALLIAGAPSTLTSLLLPWFLAQIRRRCQSSTRRLPQGGVLVTSALLMHVGRSSNQAVETTTKFLSWSFEQSKLLISHGAIEEGTLLAMEIGKSLTSVSSAISPSTCNTTMQEIISCFRSLFSLQYWYITAHTMTCLAGFASALRSHQHVLPLCVPVELQEAFKNRLQGAVCRHEQIDFEELQSGCIEKLSGLIPTTATDVGSPFAGIATTDLVPGSYLLTMPTVEGTGRSAIVIFPPGQQSLQDIKHMLGRETLEGVDVKQLQQVRGNGHGARLFSFLCSNSN